MDKIGVYFSLDNTSPQGTPFETSIPIQNSGKKVADVNQPKITKKLDSSKPLLLIDDQVMLATALAEILKVEGLQSDVCHHYDSAIKAIQSNDYSLIICDLNLSSTFVTDKILEAAKARNPSQAVAIMSGGQISRDPRITDFLNKNPETLLFSKPFDTDQVTTLFK